MAEKILIVDNNAVNRKLLIRIFEKKGYLLFEAQDKIKGLNLGGVII